MITGLTPFQREDLIEIGNNKNVIINKLIYIFWNLYQVELIQHSNLNPLSYSLIKGLLIFDVLLILLLNYSYYF